MSHLLSLHATTVRYGSVEEAGPRGRDTEAIRRFLSLFSFVDDHKAQNRDRSRALRAGESCVKDPSVEPAQKSSDSSRGHLVIICNFHPACWSCTAASATATGSPKPNKCTAHPLLVGRRFSGPLPAVRRFCFCNCFESFSRTITTGAAIRRKAPPKKLRTQQLPVRNGVLNVKVRRAIVLASECDAFEWICHAGKRVGSRQRASELGRRVAAIIAPHPYGPAGVQNIARSRSTEG